jgi:hypothetical protein
MSMALDRIRAVRAKLNRCGMGGLATELAEAENDIMTNNRPLHRLAEAVVQEVGIRYGISAESLNYKSPLSGLLWPTLSCGWAASSRRVSAIITQSRSKS